MNKKIVNIFGAVLAFIMLTGNVTGGGWSDIVIQFVWTGLWLMVLFICLAGCSEVLVSADEEENKKEGH